MRISLCNEVLRDETFPQQCRLARDLGYEGLEIAPFTLAEDPRTLNAGRIREYRRIAEDSGIRITGLHWLLVVPSGLSITTPDPAVRAETLDVMLFLVHLCADLGGEVMVHGSPKQRMVESDADRAEAEKRAVDIFMEVAEEAESVGITYCIEPLTTKETNFINTLEEAAGLVDRIGRDSFRTMLDTKAASGAESVSIPELIDTWVPRGYIGHVHLNDRNLRGPGQGEDRFFPVIRALLRSRYTGILSVEPFEYRPGGPATAAFSIGYLRGILEVLESTSGSGIAG